MQQAGPNSAQTAAMFDDLVSDSLRILLPATAVATWVWVVYVVLFDAAHTANAYVALALACGAGVVSGQLQDRSLRAAVSIYLVSLTGIVSAVVLSQPGAASLNLYLQVIFITAMLTNPLVTCLAALVVGVLTLGIGLQQGLALGALASPLWLVVVTTLAALLSARRLFTALSWALNMSQQAQRNAEEARDQRGELQRVLHSLDLAYSTLERTNRQLIFTQEFAEQAYRFKSDFVANVSHELRTPLNLIVGFSEMMTMAPESYNGVALPREYRGDLMAIYRSARHLLDLINDVLDLSQIEAGRMAVYKEGADLRDVITEAVDIVRGLADARRLELLLELPADALLVELDRIRIRQVMLNLLTNAMRYTDEGWVRVAVAVEQAEVVVTVADSGRGIAPEKLPRAFEAFDRLDEEQLATGTGLGLAVSKKFVELHVGRMWIESAVGRGTAVHFTLPRPAQGGLLPLSPVRLTHSPTRASLQPLILVLHDDPRALTLLRRHISTCEFVLAENPEQAIELLQSAALSAVLVDAAWSARWPHLTGSVAAQTPVLVCPLPSMHHLGALLGASDYLPKPVTRADLAGAIARLPHPAQTALVVDDDPHIVRLIGRMLKAIAPEVRIFEAFGGAEALAVAQHQQPDVIFLDLMMPEVNGYRLIEAIRGDQQIAHTALVVVSVRSVDEELTPIRGELRLARASGFTLTELLSVLQATLGALTPRATAPATNDATP